MLVVIFSTLECFVDSVKAMQLHLRIKIHRKFAYKFLEVRVH